MNAINYQAVYNGFFQEKIVMLLKPYSSLKKLQLKEKQ